ncbi:MAG: single-stranded DNA-binding protein [Spirochaetia bacterium]|nr:single-stranded DNA-binding protein [Spirochaetia bacterium]
MSERSCQSIDDELIACTHELSRAVSSLSWSREDLTIYNPLAYARLPHETYIRRYVTSTKRVLFLGMNPGPWGMAQTGVPFGEITAVRDWLQIEQPVGLPAVEHPKRPVTGFSTTRSEVSGRRLWALMQQRFTDAPHFFQDHAVFNYCPLVFMEPSGKNLTPDKLPAADRAPLEELCDRYLQQVITLLQPQWLVGVGKYAQKKLISLVAEREDPSAAAPEVAWILHPSPASPAANRGWAAAAQRQLIEQGIWSS